MDFSKNCTEKSVRYNYCYLISHCEHKAFVVKYFIFDELKIIELNY